MVCQAPAIYLIELTSTNPETHELALEVKYDTARQYYIRIAVSELEDRNLPDIFINVFKKRNMIECQTLDLLKWNQKIVDSHHEVYVLFGVILPRFDPKSWSQDKRREQKSPPTPGPCS